MALCAASPGLCSIIHKHPPVLLLVLHLSHSLVLSFFWNPWLTWILLKSSCMSADQPKRQRQAWVNYLAFRADGCRWYVNACSNACVCISVYVCLCGCEYGCICMFAYLHHIIFSYICVLKKWHPRTHRQGGLKMPFISVKRFQMWAMIWIVLFHPDKVLMTETIITGCNFSTVTRSFL